MQMLRQKQSEKKESFPKKELSIDKVKKKDGELTLGFPLYQG